MCEPVTLAVASFGLQAGGAIAGAVAQNKQADALKASATEGLLTQLNDIGVRAKQEVASANADTYQASKQTASTKATAATSAAEGGVGGVSTRMLLESYDRNQADYADSVQENLSGALDQLRSMRAGAFTDYNNTLRGANASRANPFAVGLRIGGAGLELGQRLHDIKKTPASTT
jgi:hypothetical protein